MTADHEKFANMVLQALGEWWASLGALAWPLIGVALVGGFVALAIVLRWVLCGGLSQHTALERQGVDDVNAAGPTTQIGLGRPPP